MHTSVLSKAYILQHVYTSLLRTARVLLYSALWELRVCTSACVYVCVCVRLQWTQHVYFCTEHNKSTSVLRMNELILRKHTTVFLLKTTANSIYTPYFSFNFLVKCWLHCISLKSSTWTAVTLIMNASHMKFLTIYTSGQKHQTILIEFTGLPVYRAWAVQWLGN